MKTAYTRPDFSAGIFPYSQSNWIQVCEYSWLLCFTISTYLNRMDLICCHSYDYTTEPSKESMRNKRVFPGLRLKTFKALTALFVAFSRRYNPHTINSMHLKFTFQQFQCVHRAVQPSPHHFSVLSSLSPLAGEHLWSPPSNSSFSSKPHTPSHLTQVRAQSHFCREAFSDRPAENCNTNPSSSSYTKHRPTTCHPHPQPPLYFFQIQITLNITDVLLVYCL